MSLLDVRGCVVLRLKMSRLRNVAWAAWERTGQKADLHCVMCVYCPLEDGEDSGSLLCPCALPPTLSPPLPRFFFFLTVTSLSAPAPLLHLLYARVTTTTNRGKVCLGAQTVRSQIICNYMSMSCYYKAQAHFDSSERYLGFYPTRHRMRRGLEYLTSPAQLLHKHMGKIMRRWGHATAELKPTEQLTQI